MSKHRLVRDGFWTDPYIEPLTPEEKLLFLYLLTNPLCNVAGIYEITLNRISLETGMEKVVVGKILQKFVEDKKILRCDNWVLLINFGKHQSINPNIEKGVRRIISELPNKIKALKGFESLFYFTLLNLTYIGDETSPDKNMYQEQTIELDEDGEEVETPATPKKYKNRNKLYREVVTFYMKLVDETGDALRHFPAMPDFLRLTEEAFAEAKIIPSEKSIVEDMKGRITVAVQWHKDQNLHYPSMKTIVAKFNQIPTWRKEVDYAS